MLLDRNSLDSPSRLVALRRLNLLNVPAEPGFDRITKIAAKALGVEFCLVSLLDNHRQFFKAADGLNEPVAEARGTLVADSFCQHVVTSDAPLVVSNAPYDPKVCDSRAIRDLGIVAYLGVPIHSPDGFVLGSFCVIDVKPREWQADEIAWVKEFAGLVETEIRLRVALVEKDAALRRQRGVLDGTAFSVIATTPEGLIEEFNVGVERMLGFTASELIGRETPAIFHVVDEVRARASDLTLELSRRIEPGFEVFVAKARLNVAEEREWTYVRKDGSHLPVLLSVTALRDANAGIIGFLCIARDDTDRRQARDALASMVELKRRTGEMAKVGGWELDLSTMKPFWSLETCRIHEVEPPVAPSLAQAIHFYAPEAQLVFQTAVKQCIDAGTSWDLELPMITAKRRSIWVRTQGQVVMRDGRAVKLIGAIQDITKRKRAENALRESEEQFKSFASLAPVGICRTDGKGRCVFVNPRWCEISGRTAAEAMGDNWGATLHPQDRRRVFAAWAALVKGEAELTLEYRFSHRDGRVVWVAGSAIALRDDHGQISGFLGSITDITAAKTAKKAMEESEERFRQAFEFAGIGMAIVGLDGRWVRVNQAICDIVGYPADQLMRKTFQEITHPEDLDRDMNYVQELIAGTRRSYQMEKRYFHRAGHVVWIRLTASLVRDATGAPVHFVSQIEDVTIRKNLELQLVASEERGRLAASVAGVGIWDWDLRTNQIAWDRQMFSLYGITPSTDGKVDYSVWAGTLHAEELAKQEIIMRNTVAQQGSSEREFRIRRHSDKAERILQAAEIVVKNEAGEAVRLVGVNRDVTEQRQNELILRSSEERLSDIYRAMADGLVLQDSTGRIVECNPAAERILGLTRDQIMGRTSLDPLWRTTRRDGTPFLGNEHPAIVTLHTGRPVLNCEMGVQKADGTLTWISVNSEPLTSMNKGVRGVVCSFSDITERKHLEESVHRERELLSTVIDLLPSPIYLKDQDSRFLMANQALANCLGKTNSAQLISLQDFDLFEAKVAAAFRADDEAVLAGKEVRDQEETTVFPNGERRTYLTTKVPFRDAQGKTTGILGIGVDITERKHLLDSLALARDQALNASRLKSEFLANMSHEIRTPMNGIIGMASLLMESTLDASQQEMGQVIQSSAEGLLTIINDILDFSKIEAGKMRIDPVEMQLLPLLDEVVALLAPQARRKELQLTHEFDSRLNGTFLGDGGRIRQVLLNLAGNAIKFTKRGHVDIDARCLEERGDEIVFKIEIKDTGIGIPRAIQKDLFQSFVQADGSTTRRFGGTGLGLAISRQLIELMGGEIGLISEEGCGSTFWFQLALRKVDKTLAPPLLVAADRPSQDSPRKVISFLVAEDNRTNQMVVRRFLEKMGHRAEFAVNGDEVLKMLALKPYDAVLMDCQMPEMDGYTATRQIRAGAVIGADAAIPIIALTAFAMPSDRAKCIDAGMDDYLAKPLRAEDLRQVLLRCRLAGREDIPPAPVKIKEEPALRSEQIEQLRSLPSRNHKTLLQEVAEIFLEETPVTMVTLRELVTARKQRETAQLAQRLAGSVASLGGTKMQAAAKWVEQEADSGIWTSMPEALTKLDHEWQRVKSALEQLQFASL